MKKIVAFLLIITLFLFPSGCGRKIETTEITMDNWEQFFTLDHVTVWNQNDFGEYDNVTISINLSLKPEFVERIPSDKGSAITVEISYDEVHKLGYIDSKAKTYTIVEEDKRGSRHDIITVYFKQSTSSAELVPGGFSSPYEEPREIIIMENGVIDRIKGTLYLYEP